MLSLTYGELPEKEELKSWFDTECPNGTYKMSFPHMNDHPDFNAFRDAVNQGIDSHLEAIFFETAEDQFRIRYTLVNFDSLYTLLRRLVETGNETSLDLASGILASLDVKWV